MADENPFDAGTPPPGSPGLPQARRVPQAGQWAPNNQGFLDWSTQTYGADPNRGSGFVRANQPFQDVLSRYTQETGNQATFLGGPSGDRVDFGQGVQDALTSSGQIWNNENTGAGGPGGSRPGGAYGGTLEDDNWVNGTNRGGGGGSDGGGGGSSSRGPQGGDGWYGTTPGQGTDLYNQLMARSKQSLNIDPNDPIIRNQADAHNAQLERGRTNYLQQVAERGGANANISAEQRLSAEKVGTGSADFESELMGREVTARRQEIQSALSGMGQLLTDEQRLQLEEELAELARAESRYQFDAGLAQRESEFGRDLGQRGYEFDTNDRYRNSPLGPGN